jgi:hypothetical protein
MIIICAVLGALGYAARFFFFVWPMKKTFSVVQRDLDRMLPNLEQRTRSHSNLPANQQAQQKMQIMNMMIQANNQMRNLQDLNRQRYEVRMGELQRMTASAGLDWKPPSY